MADIMNILTINVNSNSIKFKIYRQQKQQNSTLLVHGRLDNLYNTNKSIFSIKDHLSKKSHEEEIKIKDFHLDGIKYISENLIFNQYELGVAINKITLGTDAYDTITLLHDKTLVELGKLNELAPLNQPYNLLIAKYFMKHYPKTKHYAAFDNYFHKTIPLSNQTCVFPKSQEPRELLLNGLAFQFMSKRLPFLVDNKLAKGRWVVICLDNSNSICAIKNGKSIATIGGFNLFDSLPNLEKNHNILLNHLNDKYKLNHIMLNSIVNSEYRLVVNSSKASQKIIKTFQNKEDQLKFAIHAFCDEISSHIAKFIIYLGGIDGLIFTGIIGEHIPQIRSHIVEKFEWLGLELSKKSNNTNKFKICKKSSKIKALVVANNEELAMLNQLLDRHK